MKRRALVLGSGGLVGIAWEVGVLRGLATSGLNPVAFDLVVGTSAGAFVAGRLLIDGSVETLSAMQRRPPEEVEVRLGRASPMGFIWAIRIGRRPRLGWIGDAWLSARGLIALVRYAARYGLRALAKVGPAIRVRRPGADVSAGVLKIVGRIARTVNTRAQADWVGYWDHELDHVTSWPRVPLRAIAIDAETGVRAVLDSSSDASLAEAVAGSTSVPLLYPPIKIGPNRYIDGGARSQTNADVATGVEEVIVVAPIDRGSLTGEVATLERDGTRVSVIRPSPAASRSFGPRLLDLMDPARCLAAEQAGYIDGLAAGT
jgi:NTE family protein